MPSNVTTQYRRSIYIIHIRDVVIFMSIWDNYARYTNYVQYTDNCFLTCENYNAIINTGMVLILYSRTQYDTMIVVSHLQS